MRSFRKLTILFHRYLGIALSALFAVWFVSGIAIMYTGGMPSLTPQLRLERLPELDTTRIRVSPSEALDRALWNGDPESVTLLTLMGRPAYQIGSSGEAVTVFADDGAVLESVGEHDALAIAARFMNLPTDRVAYTELKTEADQWTIGLRRSLPLHKISVDDSYRTELYIPEFDGQVALMTTRGSRMAAWVAAIPHWLYFSPLRRNDGLWRQVVLWASGLGCALALAGLILGVLQFSPVRPFRLSRLWSYVPYKGWMRWHYVTGVVFGIFTLTWVFSGMLSMEPWYWSSRGNGPGPGAQQALAGGNLEMAQFPEWDSAAWDRALPGHVIKEIEFRRIQGEPYYVVRDAASETTLVRADPLEVRENSFSVESLVQRVTGLYPEIPLLESRLLSNYDSYYYPRGQSVPPLPVLRMKFDDPDKTWFYIDPGMSRLVGRYDRFGRLQRWLYNGFHSLDFGFWYYNRPLWDIGVILLCLGGFGTSAIGLFLGFRRMGRGFRRSVRPRST